MNSISLSKLSADHVLQVFEIEKTLQGKSAWSIQKIQDSLVAQGCNWVILESKKVIGYVICPFVLDEAEIHIIGIAPSHQRLGYATKLLQYLMVDLKRRGVTVVFLEVRESNRVAISLYIKNGFTEIAIRNNYYKIYKGGAGQTDNLKTENALIMKAQLSD